MKHFKILLLNNKLRYIILGGADVDDRQGVSPLEWQ